MNIYLDNLYNPIEFQGHRAKMIDQGHFFVSGPKLIKLYSLNVEKIVVHNVVFRLSIAWSVPEIFAIKVYSCPKSSALLVTHEPLHLAWYNFARTCTLTTSRTLLNFKVICQRSRSHSVLVFFCVRDTAATRGQYLALSKAWWSYCAGIRVLTVAGFFLIVGFNLGSFPTF